MVHQIVKKKRRGRPPLNTTTTTTTDRTSPSPAVDRRSSGRRRRNVRYNFDIDDYVDDDEFVVDDEFVIPHDDVIINTKQNHHNSSKKKMRLLSENDRRVVSHAPDDGFRKRVNHAPDYDDESEDEDERLKRRRVVFEEDDYNEVDDEIRGRNLRDYDDDDGGGGEEEEAGGSDYGMESDGPKEVERMPDQKTLEFILDKLQKKDIYGVYARPVDPEELPDYYDVIKRPMDFATVRRKLAKGSYLTLKEFESDVLLICSNAMQYNAPDTIYYKQASSIQELAKLRFQRLRTNVDRSEIEPKSEQKTLPSFSLPKKQLKKSVSLNERKPEPEPEPEPFCSETLSGANVRTEEFPNGSPAQSPVNSGEMPVNESSSLGDNNLDKDQELLPVRTPKVDLEGVQGKGVVPKLVRKPSINEEDRRATYNISVQPVTDSDSVLSTFEGESKQFIPVGLHADLAYARSLARFSATLGSVAWKVASQTIEQALPEGVKYGRGWVGEYEPLPTLPENRILKVPNFLEHFNVTSDVEDKEKGSKFTASNNHKATKILVDGKEINGGFNPRIPVRSESPRETSKNLTSGPPFLSSHANRSFSGSNVLHQNSTQMELNRPPPTHVSAADFVARRPVSNTNDIPSPRLSKPVGNLASMPSFNHPNSSKGNPTTVGIDSNRMATTINNFPYRQEVRPVAVNPATVGLESNRMAPTINNFPYRQEVRPVAVTPTTVGLDSNRTAPTINSFPYRQEARPVAVNPTTVGLDSNRTAPTINSFPYRQEVRPVAVNPTTVGLDSNRMAPAMSNFPYRQEVRPVAVNQDGNKKSLMDNNLTRQQEQHGLSDPVQMMKMLAEKAQHQQQQNNSNGFGSNRDDSNNVALTAAQAWMSLGGTGGFLKPPQTENPNPHKQISSDYNFGRDRQQPQVSRFRGEFPVSGVHYQQPVHGFVAQPVRTANEVQAQVQVHLQNRNNAAFPQLMTTDLSRFQAQSNWRGVPPQMQLQSRPKQQDSRPPDLNIGYQSLGSPVRQSTGMMVDSQQPDLALQL